MSGIEGDQLECGVVISAARDATGSPHSLSAPECSGATISKRFSDANVPKGVPKAS